MDILFLNRIHCSSIKCMLKTFTQKCTRDYIVAYTFYLDDIEIVRGPINNIVNFRFAVFVPGYILTKFGLYNQ